MNDLYIKVYWPEIQDFMEHPRYKECYMCESLDVEDVNLVSVYMVPKNLYEEVQNDKYPKEIIFEGESYETFWTYIERGDSVLILSEDDERRVLTAETSSKPPLYGSVVFDNDEFFPGINCEILGVKHL